MKKSSVSAEASPYKSVAEELERVRKAFRSLSHRYTARVESEIAVLKDAVLAETGAAGAAANAAGNEHAGLPARPNGDGEPVVAKRPTKAQLAKTARVTSQFHDLRDMLMLLRNFEVTSGVARRKDLKRVESLVAELQLLAKHWT